MQISLQQTPKHHRPLWRWIGLAVLVLLVSATVAIRLVIARAEPIVRARIIETLSNRFESKVELGSFHVSVANGIQVSGGGLKIFGATDPNPYAPGVQPLIGIQEFRFQTALHNLFRSPMHVDTVYVKGLEINIPPKGNRQEMTRMRSKTGMLSIFVDKFVCQDTKLVVNTTKPGKPPLEFAISNLNMKDIGPGQPMQFDATLVNPKPVGNIQSKGLFGPWQPESPRDTPVQGDYSFTHADLSTIKGIGGMLSSTGEYSGTLSDIVVHGTTETPDFSIASSGHPVALHTEFHATVDGTSGDTYLRQVDARFLDSSLTAKGSVVRESDPHGHDIELDVVLDHARIQDLLQLGVRMEPPIMTGPVQMTTRLSLPPGKEDVTNRLGLKGNFHMPDAHFTSQKVESKLDSLSLRSQGKPKQVRDDAGKTVPVDLRGVFTLANGVLSFSLLHFQIPGTHIDMTGDYGLDGRTIDFRGKAMMNATVSQMTTGWKSILLRPLDPFFRKDGAGTEIPIKVTGTQSDPHIGLDFGHKNENRNGQGHKDESANTGKNRPTGPTRE